MLRTRAETAAAKFDRHPIAGHPSGPIRKCWPCSLCHPIQVMITSAWPGQLSEHCLDRCLAAVRSRSEAEMSTVHRASIEYSASTAPPGAEIFVSPEKWSGRVARRAGAARLGQPSTNAELLGLI